MKENIKTTLHYYSFDVRKEDDKKAYQALTEKLKNEGLKLFDSISIDHPKFYNEKIKPLDGETIELEVKHLFDNQWNTAPTKTSASGLRVFDWSEGIYIHNRAFKQGMYLDITSEMKGIRENKLQCGYCGKQYDKTDAPIFCEKCLDSEYLKVEDLPLLRLIPITETWKYDNRAPLSEAEKENLTKLFIEAQTIGKSSRAVAKREKQRRDILHQAEIDISNTTAERDGFIWLLDRYINIDNCIYYNHTGKFCFGWRHALDNSIKQELQGLLKDFPFDYEMK